MRYFSEFDAPTTISRTCRLLKGGFSFLLEINVIDIVGIRVPLDNLLFLDSGGIQDLISCDLAYALIGKVELN